MAVLPLCGGRWPFLVLWHEQPFRLHWQRLAAFFGKASGASGCFSTDVSATQGRVSVTAALTSTMRILDIIRIFRVWQSLLRTSSVLAEEHRKLDSRTFFPHSAQIVQAVVYEKPWKNFTHFLAQLFSVPEVNFRPVSRSSVVPYSCQSNSCSGDPSSIVSVFFATEQCFSIAGVYNA